MHVAVIDILPFVISCLQNQILKILQEKCWSVLNEKASFKWYLKPFQYGGYFRPKDKEGI